MALVNAMATHKILYRTCTPSVRINFKTNYRLENLKGPPPLPVLQQSETAVV